MKYIILLIILISLLYFILNKKEHFQYQYQYQYQHQCFKDGEEKPYNSPEELTSQECECYDSIKDTYRIFDKDKDDFDAYKKSGNCNFYCPINNGGYAKVYSNNQDKQDKNINSECYCYDQNDYGNIRKFDSTKGDIIDELRNSGTCGKINMGMDWQSQKSDKRGVQSGNITSMSIDPSDSTIIGYKMMYGDKTLIIKNIPSISQSLKLDSNNPNDELGCKKDSDCYEGQCYAWEEGATGKCQKIYDIEMYEYSGDSSIILNEVDNLNISIEFVSIFSNLEESSIIRSGIVIASKPLWELNLKNQTIELNIMGNPQITFESGEDKINNSDELAAALKIETTELYTFNVLVTPLSIKFNIVDQKNGDTYEFEKSFYTLETDPKNIYECKSDETVQGYTCSAVFSGEFRRKFYLSTITFDGNAGYKIGGFKFGLDTNINKTCKFKNQENGIKSECIEECNKQELCSQAECDKKCKQAKVCNFDSKINYSRHAVDCMEKCINPKNKCENKYCKQQCWGCGSQCYWIKNSKFSEDNYDDGTGRPYPPKISLTTTSYDGTKASLKWEPPTQGSSEILGYVSLAYKTYKQDEGIKIDKIETFNCNTYCEYVLSNLEPNETYSVVVRAYNASGIGKISNLLTFETLKKTVNTDILNSIGDPSKLEIGSFETCN